MGRFSVGNHNVHAAGFNSTNLARQLELLPVFIVAGRAEHDHPATKRQLSVGDGSVFAFVDSMALKAEDTAEPIDGCGCIAIAMTGDDSAAGFSHGEGLQSSKSSVSQDEDSRQSQRPSTESGILAVMRLPQGDNLLVQIMDAALADASRRAGKWLVCRPGCTQCCHGAFAISELDKLRLVAGMVELRGSDPKLAAEIERRARGWIAENTPDFPGDAETGVIGDSDADRESFEEFANESACPALDPESGRCDMYLWRPITCRVFGPPVHMESDGAEPTEGLGHCELCFQGATTAEIAACEMPVPHELEAKLLEGIQAKSETVVAFALLC